MELKDIDYEFLISKYRHLGYSEKILEKRLQMIDPYISLKILSLSMPGINS